MNNFFHPKKRQPVCCFLSFSLQFLMFCLLIGMLRTRSVMPSISISKKLLFDGIGSRSESKRKVQNDTEKAQSFLNGQK